jgi:hypothetical protein
MSDTNKNAVFIILALLVCIIMLAPYLGFFNFRSSTEPDSVLKLPLPGSRYTAKDSAPVTFDKKDQKNRDQEHKKNLAEIEELLN